MSASIVPATRILVLELLHADSEFYHSASASMRREGRAMLLGIASDLAKWPDSEIVVAAIADTIDQFAEIDSLVTWDVCSDIPSLVQKTAAAGNRFDVAFCIAPESGNHLQETVAAVKQVTDRVLCLPDELMQLGSDKLAFHNWCIENQLPTIPILPVDQHATWPVGEGEEVVAKNRFGAGCEGIRRHCWGPETPQILHESSDSEVIWQPFVEGTFYSVGIIGRGPDSDPIVLSIAEQNICWSDGVPEYQGGRVPAVLRVDQKLQLTKLIEQVVSAFQRADGYFGLDFVYCGLEQTPLWRLVELNPRLCTSYLGYRKLYRENLAAFWWNPLQGLPDVNGENPVEFHV